MTLTLLSPAPVSRVVTHDKNSAAGAILKTEFKQVRAMLSISAACFSSACALATTEIRSRGGRMLLTWPFDGVFVCWRAQFANKRSA